LHTTRTELVKVRRELAGHKTKLLRVNRKPR